MKILERDYAERMHALHAANDVRAMAAEIAGHIPRMWLQSSTPTEFWNWFCGELNSVTRNAPTHMEQDKLRSSLIRALSRSGLPEPPKSLRLKC